MSGGGLRRAVGAQSVGCSCDCCHAARRRVIMQAACVSTAASIAALVALGAAYGLGWTLI
jgi:hypothetical protein